MVQAAQSEATYGIGVLDTSARRAAEQKRALTCSAVFRQGAVLWRRPRSRAHRVIARARTKYLDLPRVRGAEGQRGPTGASRSSKKQK